MFITVRALLFNDLQFSEGAPISPFTTSAPKVLSLAEINSYLGHPASLTQRNAEL